MFVNDNLKTATIHLSDFPASGPIGTAPLTVDIVSTFQVQQVTAGVSLTLPNPTDALAGDRVRVINSPASTVPFSIQGAALAPNSFADFVWNGAAWIPQAASNGDVLTVPAPRFTARGSAPAIVAGNGGNINGNGDVVVRLMDIPARLLTDASLQAQLELLRFRSRNRSRRGATYTTKARGWVHPPTWVGGSNITGNGPTRGGSHSRIYTETAGMVIPIDRPTEWPITGLPHFTGIILPVARTFGGWFRTSRVVDNNGGLVVAWIYSDGRGYRQWSSVNGVVQASRVTNVARFAFQYSYLDPATGLRVAGPMSAPFSIEINQPLFHYDRAAIASAALIERRIINPGADYTSANALRVRHSTDHH